MPFNAPSNPPDLARQQILQQLDGALHPTPERQAILSGDPDDPALVRARCEFIRQRRLLFADVEYLSDDAPQKASDRIGRIKPFEQLDALVMGPDVALGDAVPTDIYLVSDLGRRRLVEHFADPKLSDRRFDLLSLALAYGGVARGYLAYHEPRPGDAPAGTQPYPFLTQLAELAAQPDQSNSNRQVLLDRLSHLRDDRQDQAIRIDPACLPDIAGAVKVLDDASREPERPGNKWKEADSPELQKIKGINCRTEASAAAKFSGVKEERIHFLDMPFYETGRVRKKPLEFKLAADHLRTFQGGFIPGRDSQTTAPALWQVAWQLAWTLSH